MKSTPYTLNAILIAHNYPFLPATKLSWPSIFPASGCGARWDAPGVYTEVGGGGGRLPYEGCGDAHRLAYGCKFRVLVSLRVFIAKHEEIFLKKFFFNSFCLLDSCNHRLKRSLLGVKNRLRYARIGLLYWFNSKFRTSIPAPFIWESPPPPTPPELYTLRMIMLHGL